MRSNIAFLLVLTLTLCNRSFSRDVSGVISQDEEWSGDVNIVGNTVVEANVVLTIQPATTITFYGGYVFKVEGEMKFEQATFQYEGTEDAVIDFPDFDEDVRELSLLGPDGTGTLTAILHERDNWWFRSCSFVNVLLDLTVKHSMNFADCTLINYSEVHYYTPASYFERCKISGTFFNIGYNNDIVSIRDSKLLIDTEAWSINAVDVTLIGNELEVAEGVSCDPPMITYRPCFLRLPGFISSGNHSQAVTAHDNTFRVHPAQLGKCHLMSITPANPELFDATNNDWGVYTEEEIGSLMIREYYDEFGRRNENIVAVPFLGPSKLT